MSKLDIVTVWGLDFATHLVFCSNTTTIKKLGRGIPKIVSLFGDIRDIIDDADQHGLRLEGELDDAELDNLDEAEAVIIKQRLVFATLDYFRSHGF